HRIGYRARPAARPATIAVALLARRPPGLGIHLGDSFRRALYRGVLRVCDLSRPLRAVDGCRSGVIRRGVLRPDLPEHGSEYRDFSGVRGKRKAVSGAVAVGLLHAPGLVDQDAAADL